MNAEDKHRHEWRLVDARPLHGVEPPTTLKEWLCDYCRERKTSEHLRT
ncbi:hypothetical protein [Mycolicibacterium mageritense]|uniref:Uncharacterized protein n=1 Tax=Mycolicibacterium mageritense TaxID=53462 RepID=A0AAI8TYU6_MYCME|nr:hypothetical protein [Mycolicibacterium mageritense]BDY31396.1 hypothetical protein hbim_05348 [Mycolicibacterium mageritense]